ncbi:MAG: type II toxin-antitoxin system VapC family toxin [Desulfovibrio sp.]|jgi:PIN domain nuclease of toxin-antitoxin system|nr:type II toxin-antitoxin system VapC family toxin [Desulfovibrio sp.]
MILMRRCRRNFWQPLRGMWNEAAQESGFVELPLLGFHAEMLATMPRHHNDPFDHMLVAQAMAEPMRLITGDAVLAQYTPLVLPI